VARRGRTGRCGNDSGPVGDGAVAPKREAGETLARAWRQAGEAERRRGLIAGAQRARRGDEMRTETVTLGRCGAMAATRSRKKKDDM
jgi:hypothetical protein